MVVDVVLVVIEAEAIAEGMIEIVTVGVVTKTVIGVVVMIAVAEIGVVMIVAGDKIIIVTRGMTQGMMIYPSKWSKI